MKVALPLESLNVSLGHMILVFYLYLKSFHDCRSIED